MEVMMKYKELLSILTKAGFTIEHGGSHDKIFKDGKYIDALPRHKEINDFTASRILKKLGIR